MSFLQLLLLDKVCSHALHWIGILLLDHQIWVGFLLIFGFLSAVDEAQLDRAKQATKSAILMNLESRVCKLCQMSADIMSCVTFS